jgi:hypothetical protein
MSTSESSATIEPETPPEKPLSAILRDLSADPDRTISVAELVEAFGPRAFGAILLIFAAACALPLPPGSSTLLGAPLVLLAPQVAVGRRAPWLPKRVRDRTMATAQLRQVAGKIIPALEKVEKVSRPRFGFLFGPVGDRVIGTLCTLLSLVLILPIPLGNVLPAIAVSLLSLALVTRDGVLALAGYAMTIASLGVLTIAFGIVVRTVQHLLVIVSQAA